MRVLFQTIPNARGEFASVKRNPETGEFVARLFKRDAIGRPVHYAPADCFETDLEGACGTACAMVAV